MDEPKVYKFRYDKEKIQPLLKGAVSGASPLAYLCLFLLVMVLIFAYRFRTSIWGLIILLVGIPVYAMVAIYASNIAKEYSRRHIMDSNCEFIISKKKVELQEPTYNPKKYRKTVIPRSELKTIDYTFVSKKKTKISELKFRLKDGKEVYFLAELLDLGDHNLLQLLTELDYPIKEYR